MRAINSEPATAQHGGDCDDVSAYSVCMWKERLQEFACRHTRHFVAIAASTVLPVLGGSR